VTRPIGVISRSGRKVLERGLDRLEGGNLAAEPVAAKLGRILPAVRSDIDHHWYALQARGETGRERSVTRNLETQAVRELLRLPREHFVWGRPGNA
jgi:hypothetical protein